MNLSPFSREAQQLQSYKMTRMRAAARASGMLPGSLGVPGVVKALVHAFQSVRRVSKKIVGMAILLTVYNQAHAQSSGTWTNTVSGGVWSNPANWSGGTVADGSANTADFSTLDLTANNTVHLDSSRTIGTILFGDTATATAATWNLSNNGVAGNVLTVTNVQVGPSGTGASNSISAVMGGTNVNVLARVATGGILNLTNTNSFTGTFGLGTSGGGNRTWLPTVNLNASGGNAISGSMLQIGSGNYHQGGTVNLLASNQINDNAILNLRVAHYSGSSTFRMNGFNETIGGLTANQVGAGSPLGIVENGAATPSTLTINLASGTQTFGTGETGRNKLRIRNGGTGVLNLVKSGAGTQIIGAPTGGGETLREWITYTGTTSVNEGTLQIRNNTGFASAVTVSSGATFELQNTTGTVMIHNPSIAGAGGLTKSGAGVVQMNGQLTYTGATTISGGTLRLLAPGALPTGATVHVDASGLATGAITTWTNNGSLGATANLTGGGTVIAGGSKFNNNVVRFNGSQDLRTSGFNYGTAGTNSTVAYVGAMDGTQNFRLVTAINNWLLGYWNGTKDAAYFVNNWVVQGPATDTLGHMYIGTVDSANSANVYGDFRQIGGPSASMLGPQGLVLGGWGNNTERSQGAVGELIVYNSVLSASDRANLEAYLWRKWYGSASNGLLPSTSDVNITASGATLDINGNNQTIASLTGVAGSLVTLGSGTLTISKASGSTTFSGVISGTGSLVKTGASEQILSGANTYTGGTTVSSGVLTAGNDAAFGTGAITLAGGDLRPNGTRTIANNLISQGATSSHVINGGSGDMIYTGAISGTGTIVADSTVSRSLWFQGDPSAFQGTLNMVVHTNGTNYRLGGTGTSANTSTSGSDWSQAKFNLSGTGTNRALMWNGLNNATVKIGELSGTGGRIDLGASNRVANWEIGHLNTSTTFAGTINGAGTALTKTGTGTLTLTSPNTYTGGAVINGGTLRQTGYNGSTGAGAGNLDYTINNGGRLQLDSGYFAGNPFGSQTIDILVNSGGIFEIVSPHALGGSNLNGGSWRTVTLDGGTLTLTREQYVTGGLINGNGRLVMTGGLVNGTNELRATSQAGGAILTILPNATPLRDGCQTRHLVRWLDP
jgi:fibronectin-binding autotransporter adhesin